MIDTREKSEPGRRLTTQERLDQRHDRVVLDAKNLRRTELLALVLVLGVLFGVSGVLFRRVVRQAQVSAHMQNVKLIRLGVAGACIEFWDRLEPDPETHSVNFYLSPDPAADPDDPNGALLRGRVEEYLAVDQWEWEDRPYGSAVVHGPDTGWVWQVRQQNGLFTIRYWESRESFEKNPGNPDCLYAAAGDGDEILASLPGAFAGGSGELGRAAQEIIGREASSP